MQQDIRNLCKNVKEEPIELSSGHEQKFRELLNRELHSEQKASKKSIMIKWMSVAASFALILSIAIQFYPNEEHNEVKQQDQQITLGRISPELNTIESYYVNSINLAISELDLNEDNKEVVDGYLLKIAELTKEYKLLTQELNTKGVNDLTINALIRNLQLRLELLQRLQKQLQKLNTLNTKQDETQI